MTHAAKRNQSSRPATRAPVPHRVPRRGDLGFGALIVSPDPPPTPATNASWAWSLRRFARGMVWAFPLYALVYGLLTLGRFDGANLVPYLARDEPLYLAGWLASVWLGLMAPLAVTALLAAARSRRIAMAGFMLGAAGVILTLPFTVLPGQTSVSVVDARTLVLAGATVQSLAWAVTGWAVVRSAVLAAADGVVLMVAAPMLGVAGLLVAPLQTVGALLVFAAGLGMVWRAGRLLPMPGREAAVAAGVEAVTARAATQGGLATP